MSILINIVDIPKEPADRRAWFIWQLKRRGLSLRRLAFKIGVSPSAVSIAFQTPSSHIEREIAKAIGVKVEELFPERFDAAGNRLYLTRTPERSTAKKRRNVQVESAA